jgi:hypothetical protein
LKATEKKSRIRISYPVLRIRGSGSVSKRHRSGTLDVYPESKFFHPGSLIRIFFHPESATKNLSSVADPDPGLGDFLTPGSGMGRKSASGSGMNNSDHIFKSLETFLIFWGLKYFNSLMRIRDPGWRQFGSGMETVRIRDPGWRQFGSGMETLRIRDGKKSDPGSGINIPDPQH